VEVLKGKTFIGGMGTVIGAAPPHKQDALAVELFLEEANNGDGTTLSNE
jgi:hypothetical protein